MGATWAMASARALAVPAKVKQCLALWNGNRCGAASASARESFGWQNRYRERANRLPGARLLHVTHALIMRACHCLS